MQSQISINKMSFTVPANNVDHILPLNMYTENWELQTEKDCLMNLKMYPTTEDSNNKVEFKYQ